MNEAKVVFFPPEQPKRSFWQKAREGEDQLLLAATMAFGVSLLFAIIRTILSYNQMAVLLSADQTVLVLVGVFTEIILFAMTVYGVLALIGQIEERE